jgi:hypothetical protein
MTNSAFAACAQIRNAVFCSLVTVGLAACGSSGSSSSAATASVATPNVGVISRAPGSGSQTATPPATNPVPSSNSGSTNTSSTPPSVPPPTQTASTGTATLDWTPPTQNSDGSTLTDLAGYYVYYGTSADKLTQSVKITNPGLSAYTLSNLSAGTWYFAVSSYSAAGIESARSGVVSSKI